MTFEDALVERTKAIALVASRCGGRVGWDPRLEGEPAIVFQIVNDARPQHYKGFQRLRATAVQVDIWSADPSEAVALREAVIADLVQPMVVGAIRFQRAMIGNVRSATNPNQSTSQRFRDALARESIDFSFLHNA
ncbi:MULTISPECIES: hypothetical protein [Sphingomonas]|uniref:hypothetical protein n=1 Tax=Sphingomonas TaxID=13687 RepID=UPI00254AA49C|nr:MULTISPECIES: hypothetical protein [Sphingomonas]MDK8186719.1 hypothetical protein [Sphingomonas zeae]MDK8216384.1 hypothetical protein [Sphingomonas sp. UMB7805-LC452B]